jgi:hypothetical protein
MSNDCAQRVMWGFGIGGGLGASIGAIKALIKRMQQQEQLG